MFSYVVDTCESQTLYTHTHTIHTTRNTHSGILDFFSSIMEVLVPPGRGYNIVRN